MPWRSRAVGLAVVLGLVLASASPRLHADHESPPARTAPSIDPSPSAVTIVVFSDFQCPYCARLAPELRRLMNEFPDRVNVVFKHLPLPMHADAPLAHLAALAAGEQGHFWEMHDLLFADQRHLDEASLVARARSLKLDVDAFSGTLRNADNVRRVNEDVALAQAFGVSATPTLFVNGQRLTGAQDYAALKRLVDPAAAPAATGDPVQIDVSDAPALGAATAPVTMVLFSDFQCPFCSRIAPTVHELHRLYGDDLRIVFKHFPLPIHPSAPLVHAGANAAAQQGKFWEFHDRLFGNQKAVGRADLARLAQELGLDADRFARDLDAEQTRVAADLAEGRALGVTGTPTAFINGREVGGALPIERFQQVIDGELGLPTPSRTASVPAGAAPSLAAIAAAPAPIEIRASTSRGPAGAPIVLQWFSDLGSPLTRKADVLVRELERKHPGQIRIAFHHLPLERDPDRLLLHKAADEAAGQGRFWAFHEGLLAAPAAPGRDALLRIAREAGVAEQPLLAAIDDTREHPDLDSDLASARRRDIRGTPTFFVNQHRVDGLQPLAFFEQLIDAELATTGRQ